VFAPSCIRNVDFYSGIIYSALGIPRSMFTRDVRHRAHRRFGWRSGRKWCPIPHIADSAGRASLYTGPTQRDYQTIEKALIDGGATLRDILRRPWAALAARRRRKRRAPQMPPVRVRAGPVALSNAQWNGWGRGLDNTRYQPEPAIRASDVAKLALKWAFGYQSGTEIRSAHPRGRKTVRHQLHGPHLLARCQKPAVPIGPTTPPREAKLRLRSANWRGQEFAALPRRLKRTPGAS